MQKRNKISSLFFLLSGEHPTLPFSELKSILEAEGHEYHVSGKLTQVLRLKTNVNSIRAILARAAMTRICASELFSCNASFPDIYRKMQNAPLDGLVEKGQDFVVRVRRVGETAPNVTHMELERRLGEIILNRVEGVKVNLHTPKKTFFGVLTDNQFVFGKKMAEISPTPFVKRNPKKRPFFHPSAMPAKLARCMVNLARPKAGELVLDAFCGTASLLVEAGLIGCRVIGLDVQRYMVKGSLKNLRHFRIEPQGMAVANALNIPVSEADCIVTDPPYGRLATTLGQKTKHIITDFLSKVGDRMPKCGKICIASPKTVKIGEIGEALGFKRVESHFVYVHRSLTREIVVFERS
jgi:tRNA (guanine10-N2)-dimethyltransferase